MSTELWQRYQDHLFHDEKLGLSLDLSRMNFPEDFFENMSPVLSKAFVAMDALEQGAIANPDENRMVGHYWLRSPAQAPDPMLSTAIKGTLDQIRQFTAKVHGAELRGANDEPFSQFLLVGIGGSALGPQLVADALGTEGDVMTPYFLDNTDPDGMARTLNALKGRLDRTLTIVISKSGGTPETRNGMFEAQAAYKAEKLPFASHAVAVTSTGSKLDKMAEGSEWLARFPMWDWVGGRTSITSAVGLLPMALQGIDIDEFLQGAADMDALTRSHEAEKNPAALMALMWHWAGQGHGRKDMVILPYRDRLVLFSKYLQQLVMESLGKEKDLDGNEVHQGLSVFGNKGSTDQHAYVQQLREGLNNFFAVFVEVLSDEAGSESAHTVEVEPGITSGDYLEGFFLGTRQALHEMRRESMTLTIRRLGAHSLGMLIALFERAVGLYASMININAYHQPGVEAGKKAAAAILELQGKLLKGMQAAGGERTASDWAEIIGEPDQAEMIFKLLERLAHNPGRGIARKAGKTPAQNAYEAS